MKKLTHTVSALLSVILLPASAQSLAQAATLDDCQAIADRLARYACYDTWDSASGAVRQSAPRAASAPVQQQQNTVQADAQPPAATGNAESGVDTFGRSQSTARVIDGDDGTELIDRIAALEQSGPSMWLVTLEGGQQWKQMISKRYNLAVGEEVRIYPTGWGSSFRLSSERVGGYIQVRRVDTGSTALAGNAPAPRSEQPAPAQAREAQEERSLLGRLFDRSSAPDEPETVPQVASEPAATEGAASSVDGFGRSQATARVMEGADGKSELIDTVAALEQRGPSMWLITLEGGQRWQQMLSKRYNLSVGDEIRIYPTRWGSAYRLSSPKAGGFIQVERVD